MYGNKFDFCDLIYKKNQKGNMEEEYIPLFNDSDVGYCDYEFYEEKKEEIDEDKKAV